MEISYSVPMQQAWARMRRMLFHPFALERWFVLGFAAFLSEWLTGGVGGSGGGRFRGGGRGHEMVSKAREVLADPVWLPLLVAGVLGVVLLIVLFQWIGSRGKFVFLDGVVRERHAIAAPWREYAAQGNSLFLWRLVFGLVVVALVAVCLVPIFGIVFTAIEERHLALLFVGPALLAVAALAGIGLASAFVLLMLDAFVVPLMYRDRLSVTAAWARFMPLLSGRWPAFLMFALLVLVLHTAFIACIVAVGFATCCVGFVLFAAPYLGQVVLLPVYVFFRALGPEFLRQFGPGYDALAVPAAGAVPPAPGAGA